jgi:prophage regulatory protein
MMQKITLSKPQLLDELGIAENTLRALINSRGLPYPRKMGVKLFWLVEEVLEWLRQCPKGWGGEALPGE